MIARSSWPAAQGDAELAALQSAYAVQQFDDHLSLLAPILAQIRRRALTHARNTCDS